MDRISPDSGTAGGWKVNDTNGNGRTPTPLGAATFAEAITQKQQEMASKGTMKLEESQAHTTTWYAIEKGDNLWSMTKRHLESTWGRSVSDQEVADYWRKVCNDNPFLNDNLIYEGQVVAFRDPGVDPKNEAGSGTEIDKKAQAKDPSLKGDLDKYFAAVDKGERAQVVLKLLESSHSEEGRQAIIEAYLSSLPKEERAEAAEALKAKYPQVKPGQGQGHDGHLTDADKLNNKMPSIIDKALQSANAGA